MMVVQVQLPVAPQVLPAVSRQLLPMQHGLVVEHDWPAIAHAEAWQVPVVEPLGLLQARPVQQSADAVHTWFNGEHSFAGWQEFGPPSVEVQIPAQHSDEAAQVLPVALQVPASTAPPSGVGGGGSRHARPLLDAPQIVPAQQVTVPASAPQLVPSGRRSA